MAKAIIVAKVKNSPKMPIAQFLAEHTVEFDDTDNVFGRMAKFRQEFRSIYGQNIELELVSCTWIDEDKKD